MNFILAIPLVVRLIVLFGVGVLAGAAVNWATYTFAWNRRPISPWSTPPRGAPRRSLADRVPVAGWWWRRREASLHGRGFWIRPLVVELAVGLVFAGLYFWEIRFPPPALPGPAGAVPAIDFLTTNVPLVLHVRYLSHVLLVMLMAAASLVDLDEKTIPDAVTVPGTLAALTLAAAYPWSLPTPGHFVFAGREYVEFLTLASPNAWPAALDAWPQRGGLALALACWTLWCVGLLPRYWNLRRGWAIACRVFWHRLRVARASYRIAGLWLVGLTMIGGLAARAPAAHWAGLATALVGVAAGGGLVWLVRVIAGSVLAKEAMGFGDVTLMAMFGAFLGWQATLMIFFVAPFFAIAFALANWVAHRDHEIPYGPFLCAAAAAVVLRWPAFWERAADVFSLGWLVPAMVAACLALLGVLLWFYRLLGQLLFGGR